MKNQSYFSMILKTYQNLICLFVCQSVTLSLPIIRFGQLLCCADKCIVNIMKVYIKRNNLPLYN